jgi:hypothetical protein
MIMIAGHVSSVTIHNVAWSMGKTIPDRFPLAVLVPSAFDLIGRTCDAPKEVFRKSDTSPGHPHAVSPFLLDI